MVGSSAYGKQTNAQRHGHSVECKARKYRGLLKSACKAYKA